MRGFLVMAGILGVLASLAAADGLAALGIAEADGRTLFMEALNSGSVNLYSARKALKAASPAGREALVNGALAWAKAYTQSAEFATAYARLRENRKPEMAASKGGVDEQVSGQRAELQKSIAEMKRNFESMSASVPPETRKAMEEGMQQAIKAMTEQLARMDTAESRAQMKAGIDAQQAGERETYQREMKEWETRYPADPRPVIARRLQQFLDESATVDFSAKLVSAGGMMRFADPKYEQKSSDWKTCYRAGKPAVDAARAFATAWMAELGKK